MHFLEELGWDEELGRVLVSDRRIASSSSTSNGIPGIQLFWR